MKRLSLLVLVLLVSVPGLAWGQALVQQSATRLDAAALFSTSAASAATITISPPSGQFVYLTGVDITNCAGALAVTAAAPTSVTSTGFGSGTTPVWTVGSGTTAGACQPSPASGTGTGITPLKSNTAGAAVTLVTPTAAANQTVRVSAYYYFAP